MGGLSNELHLPPSKSYSDQSKACKLKATTIEFESPGACHDAADIDLQAFVRAPIVPPGSKQAGVGGDHQVAEAAVLHLQLSQASLQCFSLLKGRGLQNLQQSTMKAFSSYSFVKFLGQGH